MKARAITNALSREYRGGIPVMSILDCRQSP